MRVRDAQGASSILPAVRCAAATPPHDRRLFADLSRGDLLRAGRPADKAKGWIAFSHGLSEYSGRYDKFGKTLAEAGYALVMVGLSIGIIK